jgi:hypothetical protein
MAVLEKPKQRISPMSKASRARQAEREASGEVRPDTKTGGRRNRRQRYAFWPSKQGSLRKTSDGKVYVKDGGTMKFFRQDEPEPLPSDDVTTNVDMASPEGDRTVVSEYANGEYRIVEGRKS